MLIKSKFAKRSTLMLATVTAVFIALPTVAVNAASVTHLSVVAKGKYEKAGKGAMSGSVSASFTIDSVKKTLCYTIKNKGISGISGVHIHTGAAGVDGGVAVALDPMKIGHKAATCIPVAAAVLDAIEMHPSGYYFNAHTPMYPNGAVRGQLDKMMTK